MDKELQRFAIQIVRKAGGLALSRFGKIKSSDITYKRSGNRSPVTDVDIKINKYLSAKIHSKYPSHSIISEESKIVEGTKFSWVIDPIDGTRNYLNGKKDYSVTVAVIENKKIIFGIIFLPSLKKFYHVVRGEGVYKNGKKLKAHKKSKGVLSVLGYPKDLALYKEKLGQNNINLIVPSRCVTKDLVDITDGVFDCVFYQNVHIWDYAAGVLMVEEMGGKALNFRMKPYNIRTRDLIVLG